MRKIVLPLLLLLNSALLLAKDYPRPSGHVSDFAGVINSDYRSRIEAAAVELERKTSAEIAVVTVESLENGSIEELSEQLFSKWGIGKKDKNNGILIIAAVKDKTARIEVGYGLEGIIPDGKAGSILDSYMLPYFRQGNFGEGFLQSSLAVASIIAADANVELSVKPAAPRRKPSQNAAFGILVLFIIVISIVNGLRRRKYGRTGRYYPGYRGPYIGGGGFGGGFGGFGGGMSGGGGASRGW
ncbi:MAG TPA: methanol dehydrogenase [Elusimicrobia bacterium]|nr:MAG: hypothetical protein A2278_01075 [Elusimicrobia bacterium RIFOXYA12_FULL_49_49]OGS11209.1 MAG: hypothetical protein A2386_04595 [Elusimicrobia bacterium RIFOXYB1_FULL_48_9]OGS15789.1 MAG: hypothetical protein A2251_03975 [Elusimicrobia bacterium RIFOXYA2_FULL_47_53]OGS25977.1 MAG: hypothetical protein A2339_05365 [Elusimicrobia bacterium RIFOXYB12_FULL_50_12]OGS31121.1 MAG: hypothetical protein A2323_08695 [Elusimicrobia bacterium RIFOXYB2_FULL_46_23]HBU69479.1 methanol dehydrogenase [